MSLSHSVGWFLKAELHFLGSSSQGLDSALQTGGASRSLLEFLSQVSLGVPSQKTFVRVALCLQHI